MAGKQDSTPVGDFDLRCDTKLEIIIPHPDVYELFDKFNAIFFSQILDGVQVYWSKWMSCISRSYFYLDGMECIIRLSAPLLHLRSRECFIDVLLHEMIHAYLFRVYNRVDRKVHCRRFCYWMKEINSRIGSNITIDHCPPIGKRDEKNSSCSFSKDAGQKTRYECKDEKQAPGVFNQCLKRPNIGDPGPSTSGDARMYPNTEFTTSDTKRVKKEGIEAGAKPADPIKAKTSPENNQSVECELALIDARILLLIKRRLMLRRAKAMDDWARYESCRPGGQGRWGAPVDPESNYKSVDRAELDELDKLRCWHCSTEIPTASIFSHQEQCTRNMASCLLANTVDFFFEKKLYDVEVRPWANIASKNSVGAVGDPAESKRAGKDDRGQGAAVSRSQSTESVICISDDSD